MAMTEHYHKWFSQYIGQEFEMLVFGTAGIPVVLFPPEKERYFSAKDNGLISSAANLLEQELIKIYCPDSFDSESWFNFSEKPQERVKGYLNFEQLVIHDVVGFAKYETEQFRVILAGAGFGGYHALNFALKHPDMASGLISLSGYYDIKQFIYGYYDDECYFNNPPNYLPGLTDSWYVDNLKKMKILFGCSSSDLALGENKFISSLLDSKGITNKLEVDHTTEGWELWRNLLPRFISTILKET